MGRGPRTGPGGLDEEESCRNRGRGQVGGGEWELGSGGEQGWVCSPGPGGHVGLGDSVVGSYPVRCMFSNNPSHCPLNASSIPLNVPGGYNQIGLYILQNI